ncbi:dihydrolipoyl dehydrogenase [Sedimenticola hydrogenitrophicus]|uniref:dihydrolipoyl dehydrogenase n=1 Tax=Sedimenticola hydrogenitrophicus TaxID=2967975 RepID=UPI0023AF185C|nr:dihydrolipoyl dehydrogenase [Sedimenticola hydrogenitrophicus]
MSNIEQIHVPDIGEFEDVEIIEILVSAGDAINIDDPLLTLESDKASMEIPSPFSGTVQELFVKLGDRVSTGSLILSLDKAAEPKVAVQEPQPLLQKNANHGAAPGDAGKTVLQDVYVPDIGDFQDVDVIEVLVMPGDRIGVDTPMLTLESDKASMELPSPSSGTVHSVHVQVGEQVSQGDLVLTLEVASPGGAGAKASSARAGAGPTPAAPKVAASQEPTAYIGNADIQADVVVLGAGPGGYTAAFRAADLGKKVILIERHASLGGVCLNVGCIPSKALLHAAKVLEEARDFRNHGLKFIEPEVDLDALRDWKNGVVSRLTGGLMGLAKQRKVQVVNGYGKFIDQSNIEVTDAEGQTTTVGFSQCIIAAGSAPVKLPFLPDDERIIDSTGALMLKQIPKRMLVIGGGIIGLEMATVYHALGSRISVVEMLDGLITGADKDIVKPLHKKLEKQYEAILTQTRVSKVEALDEGLRVTFEGAKAPEPQLYDAILVAVGRAPNGHKIDAQNAGVAVDDHGFIHVDKQQRSNVPHIFAIGDVVGQPMLAHKAVHEGKVAAEVCAGLSTFFDAWVIPSVAYTDPEIAWVGKTEAEAKAEGIKFGKGAFPWAASGRSLSLGRDEGLTKMIFDEESGQVIGAGIVGPNAGDLIAEVCLAIEMGCDASDIGLTVHPHPTLSETVAMAAEAFEGSITDLFIPKRKK